MPECISPKTFWGHLTLLWGIPFQPGCSSQEGQMMLYYITRPVIAPTNLFARMACMR